MLPPRGPRAPARRAAAGLLGASLAVAGLPAAATPVLADPVALCAAGPTVRIGSVQGAGDTTPLAGQEVTVRGVVVGDLPELGGFSLQDADGDGDPATSDAVFVASDVPVGLGDTVAAGGVADESFGSTQVRAGAAAEVCATGGELPPPAALDLPADDTARERLEGMLVAPATPLTVSDVFDPTSFGELTLSAGGVLVQPTELARPGTAAAAAIAADNGLRSVVLDDGAGARLTPATAPYLSPGTPVRVGDELTFTAPWSSATASAAGDCSPPTAAPRAPSLPATAGRRPPGTSAATCGSARSTCSTGSSPSAGWAAAPPARPSWRSRPASSSRQSRRWTPTW